MLAACAACPDSAGMEDGLSVCLSARLLLPESGIGAEPGRAAVEVSRALVEKPVLLFASVIISRPGKIPLFCRSALIRVRSCLNCADVSRDCKFCNSEKALSRVPGCFFNESIMDCSAFAALSG